jgi:uncharacterized protein (DUF362 family)/Pyruvate/2-oxoacid:ferredoxin oxidoreductase delta subunit
MTEGRDPDPKRCIVSAAACGDYSRAGVRQALERVLEPIGGLSFVHPGMRVAIKANLVAAREPEKAATTNPVLIAELCRMLAEAGADVVVGDSPGGPYSAAHLKNVYRTCGLSGIPEMGGTLNEDFSENRVFWPEAVAARSFTCTAWLQKADAIINFCKLKTHGMMKMTCAVKNMFGSIPGMTKPEYHMRFPDRDEFADMLIDLNEYFHPVLNLVDAVDCMEGNGPTAGTKRHIGLILAGTSPYAVDEVSAHLIGLEGGEVPTITAARRRGLSEGFKAVRLSGDGIGPFVTPDFKTDIREIGVDFGAGRAGRFLMNAVFAARPQVRARECVGCGVCKKVCPAKAITMRGGKPEIDRSRCIRCFCCQEFCPKGAMKVHHTWIGSVIRRAIR